MQFHLVDAQDASFAFATAFGLEFGYVSLKFVEVVYTIVADADGVHLTSFDGLNKLRICPLSE
jgi:hypothetical protein